VNKKENKKLGAFGMAYKDHKLVAGAKLTLTVDCRLEVVDPKGNVIWSPKLQTDTFGPKPQLTQCYMVLQDDGDVVMYANSAKNPKRSIVWTTDSCVYN
jgi:hypothetical protein